MTRHIGYILCFFSWLLNYAVSIFFCTYFLFDSIPTEKQGHVCPASAAAFLPCEGISSLHDHSIIVLNHYIVDGVFQGSKH
jgi:hypothetical protein